MIARRPLVGVVQGLLERTYRIPGGLVRADRFVIGDRGLRRLYRGDEAAEVRSADGQGARLLVRHRPEGLRAAVYFPDAMIRCLERFPPHRGVGEENVDAFATLVEEVDHLLVLADRYADGRTVSCFELELHANVSKWLVVSRFLAGRRGRLPEASRWWLRWHLFGKRDWTDGDPEVRARYRDAERFAVQFLDALARDRAPARRIRTLRRFHAVPSAAKVEMIRDLAA